MLRVRSIRLILPLRDRLWVTITCVVVVEVDANANEGTVLGRSSGDNELPGDQLCLKEEAKLSQSCRIWCVGYYKGGEASMER